MEHSLVEILHALPSPLEYLWVCIYLRIGIGGSHDRRDIAICCIFSIFCPDIHGILVTFSTNTRRVRFDHRKKTELPFSQIDSFVPILHIFNNTFGEKPISSFI